MKTPFCRPICLLLAAGLLFAPTACTDSGDVGNPQESIDNPDDDRDVREDSAEPAEVLAFSHPGGLYREEFSLQLTTDLQDAVIRYTLDGSDPTDESERYEDSIPVTDRTGESVLLQEDAGRGGGAFPGRGGDGFPGGGPGGWPGGGDRPERDRQGSGAGGPQPPQADAVAPEGFRPNSAGTTEDAGDMVFQGTVVKAAVFSGDGETLSDIHVQSYFVSEDIFDRYRLPVVSIVTDADHFFDEESGIYANYRQSGADWERPVHFELYEADGTPAVSQFLGARINGGTTRQLTQKALRFYARGEYDEQSSVNYELFEGLTTSNRGEPLTNFKRFLLRSSGNDNSGALFRDALMHALVDDLHVDTQASRPCVAFINGEFWGIYNIRERYDSHYFAGHYGIDRDRVAMLTLAQSSTPEINEGDESDLDYYNEMWNFFNDNSMTTEEHYRKAQEYLDIDNFMDYYIANIYCGNHDWPGNNNVFWRYKTDNGGLDSDADAWYLDGRFRWAIKDMDWGFGLMVDQTRDTLAHALGEGTAGRGGFNADWSTLFFRRLLENDDFRDRFLNRFCDVMNTNYREDVVTASILARKGAIEAAVPEHARRFPSSVPDVGSWESSVDSMIAFAQERPAYMQGFLAERFSRTPASVTLQADPSAGYICINDIAITAGTRGVDDPASWSGHYFSGTIQAITAVPVQGHSFVKWIVTDNESGEKTEYTSPTVALTVNSGGMTVQAIFRE